MRVFLLTCDLSFLFSCFKTIYTKHAIYPERILSLCLLFNRLFDITPIFSLESFEQFKRILTHILRIHTDRGAGLLITATGGPLTDPESEAQDARRSN